MIYLQSFIEYLQWCYDVDNYNFSDEEVETLKKYSQAHTAIRQQSKDLKLALLDNGAREPGR